MGMTPANTEARPVRTTPAPRPDRTPEPETRAKFEDALDRREKGVKGKDAQAERTDGVAAGQVQGQMPQGQGLDFMQDDPRGGHKGRHGVELTASDDLSAATPVPVANAAPAPVEVTTPQAPATLASSYAEFAARMDLPTTITGAETQLTMTDHRWLASQAVVASDGKGGLMLDVQTQGDGSDAEQQRDALRARLEARGHRIEGLTFHAPDRR